LIPYKGALTLSKMFCVDNVLESPIIVLPWGPALLHGRELQC
jgi:hypothetical protein